MGSSAKRTIPGLDGLRCIAVLLVVAFHHYPRGIPGWDWVYRSGWAGVDLFFVLSGFLITGLLLKEARGTGSLSLTRFWARRFLRLWPAWLATLALSSAVVWRLGASDPALREALRARIFDYLLCYGNYSIAWHGNIHAVFGHYWSLAVEDHFYLLWPLAILALRRKPRALLAVTVAGLVIPVLLREHVVAAIADPEKARHAVQYATHLRFDSLLWGCLLAQTYPRLPRLRALGTWAAILSGIALFAGSIAADSSVWVYTGVAAASVLLVWAAAGGTPCLPNLFLNSRLASWIGRISYSVYLIHPVALTIAFACWSHLAAHHVSAGISIQILTDLVFAVGLGALLHVTIETRFDALRDRLRPPAETLPAGPTATLSRAA